MSEKFSVLKNLKSVDAIELDFIINYLTQLCKENPKADLCNGDYILMPTNDAERAKNKTFFPADLKPTYRGTTGRIYVHNGKIIKSSVDEVNVELHEIFINMVINDFVSKNPQFKDNFIKILGFFLCGQQQKKVVCCPLEHRID